MRVITAEEVRARLTYELCIPVVREAMIHFSAGQTQQLLRSVLPLGGGSLFGVMPGGLGEGRPFGAKLVSVFPGAAHSHQGWVALFDGQTGAPLCMAEAGAVTAIRTGAASAVATNALARPDANRLALFGAGEQALSHARALARARPLASIAIWGRDLGRAQALAGRLESELGLPVTASGDGEATAAGADIICTVTASREPVLLGRWVRPGTHVNLVGSSVPGPVEADHDLVVRARIIADSRPGVLAQGAEFLAAKAAGLVGDDHVVGEIGQVLAGELEGRQSADQVTVYKSLGHIAQDLAAVEALLEQG